MNTSPPGPDIAGLTTLITPADAIAASTALPPSCRTASPAVAARGCPAATIPRCARIVGRGAITFPSSETRQASRACTRDRGGGAHPGRVRRGHPPEQEGQGDERQADRVERGGQPEQRRRATNEQRGRELPQPLGGKPGGRAG